MICIIVFPLVTLNGLDKKKKKKQQKNQTKGKRSMGDFYLSYLVLDLHIFQLVFQLGECWSYFRVSLPAFQHYLIPTIEIICFYEYWFKTLIAIAN